MLVRWLLSNGKNIDGEELIRLLSYHEGIHKT